MSTLHDVTVAYRSEGTADERLSAIGAILEPDADRILAQCEAHEATSGRNHLPFLTQFYSHQRAVLFWFLGESRYSRPHPTRALRFLLAHKTDRHEWTPVVHDGQRPDGSLEQTTLLDLSFVAEKWWPVLTGSKSLDASVARVLRRPLELCILTEVMQD